MSRSTKKGPYVDERLLEKISKMNETLDKKVKHMPLKLPLTNKKA